jgi:comEA protein
MSTPFRASLATEAIETASVNQRDEGGLVMNSTRITARRTASRSQRGRIAATLRVALGAGALIAALALPLAAQVLDPGSEPRQAPEAARPARATAPLNLNTATADELEALPGIGPATATRIVEYRQKNGPFKKIEDLMNIKGIGEKSFLKLKPLVSVTPPRSERPTD